MLWLTLSLLSPLASAGPELVSLTAGRNHACALGSDGVAWCWGDNRFGQLGVGDVDPRTGAVRVEGLPPVRHLLATGDMSCALDDGYRLWCWGSNVLGAFPSVRSAHHPSPEPMTGAPPGSGLVSVADHPCVITTDRGNPACVGARWGPGGQASWRRMLYGHRWAGTEQASGGFGMDVTLPDDQLPASLAVAETLTCRANAEGSVECLRGAWTEEPARFDMELDGPALEVGAAIDACARTTSEVVCFDRDGQITDTRDGRFDALAVGPRFRCVAERGVVSCWGSNQHGQLGATTGAMVESDPVEVTGLPRFSR